MQMIRFFLILMLVWQPLSLQAVAVAAPGGAMHHTSDCCEIVVEVVEANTCCEPVVVSHCGNVISDCRCDAKPGPAQTPTPATPTISSPERNLAALPRNEVAVIDWPRSDRQSPRGVQERLIRSHNTFQAFVGIWRT